MKWLIFAQALQEEKANRTEIFFTSNKCDSEKIILNKNEKSLKDILEKIPSSDGFLFFSDVENSALILSCVLGFCYGKNMPVLVLDEEKKFIKLFPCENKKLSLKNFYSENELFN